MKSTIEYRVGAAQNTLFLSLLSKLLPNCLTRQASKLKIPVFETILLYSEPYFFTKIRATFADIGLGLCKRLRTENYLSSKGRIAT